MSQEAALAGKNAARYVMGDWKEGLRIPLEGKGGVRYTVPSAVCPENMEDKLAVRFRVGDVYRDRQMCVYLDGERISRAKKRVMAPGEMESVILKKSDLLARPGLQKITVAVEEAE